MLDTNAAKTKHVTTKQFQNYIYHNLCKNYLDKCSDELVGYKNSKTLVLIFGYNGFALESVESMREHDTSEKTIKEYYLQVPNPLYKTKIDDSKKVDKAIIKKFLKQLTNKLTISILLTPLMYEVPIPAPNPNRVVYTEDSYYHWILSNLSRILNILSKKDNGYDFYYNHCFDELLRFLLQEPDFDDYLLNDFPRYKRMVDKSSEKLAFFLIYLISKEKLDMKDCTLLALFTKEVMAFPIPALRLIVLLGNVCNRVKINLSALPFNYLPIIYAGVCNTQDKYKTEVLEYNLKHFNFKVVSQSDLDAFKRNLKQVSMPSNDIVIMTIDDLVAMLKKYQPKIDKGEYQAEIDKILHYKCEKA